MNAQKYSPYKFRIMQQFRRAVVSKMLKGILGTLCKIDDSEFSEAISKTKPLLIIFNHINFLEVPILMSHSYPVKCTGMAKDETWKNPFFSFLFNTYKAIPINRDGSYRETFKRIRDAIDNGFHVFVAPEGHRSKDGILQKGMGGIIQLALDADAAILPIAHYGGQDIWYNIKHLKRTPFKFKAGRPFRIKCDGRPGKSEREIILEEIMVQLARLLPTEMRGVYSEHAEQKCTHLEYID